MPRQPPTHQFDPDELLRLVRRTADELGEPLTIHRFCRHVGVSQQRVYRHFRSWHDVREAAGLPRVAPNTRKFPESQLLEQFHRVTVQLRRYPTPVEFQRLSSHSYQLLYQRIGTWPAVKQRYRDWLQRERALAFPDEREQRCLNPQLTRDPAHDVAWLRDTWLGLRVGFELQSRDFHGRDPSECDLLIVLDHDDRNCLVPGLELGQIVPVEP
jgi:AcrR family transcriptional regulator